MFTGTLHFDPSQVDTPELDAIPPSLVHFVRLADRAKVRGFSGESVMHTSRRSQAPLAPESSPQMWRYPRTMRAIHILTLLAAAAAAQQTRKEIVNPGVRDAQPNDPKVPDAYAIPTQFDRVLVLRFKNQTDLLDGLQRMVKQNHIRNAVILNGTGSVIGYQIHQVSNRAFPSKNTYVADPTHPADIAAMSGYVLGGNLHPHIVLADPDKAFGGHLEPGTKVFTFAIVTVGVLPDSLDLSKLDDKNYR